MKWLRMIRTGIPIKQNVHMCRNEDVDNFYLIRMEVVDYDKKDSLEFKSVYHLFTTKELITAANRYYKHVGEVIDAGINTMVGYTYPFTYANQNGGLTTRWFVRFDSSNVEELENKGIQCAMFSAREMRRSRDRVSYMTFVDDSWISRIIKGIRSWLHRIEEI